MALEEISGQIRKAPHNNNYHYLDDKIANVFSSLTDDVTSKINYLYIINSDPIYITNVAQDAGKFTIDVVNTTHLLLGFMFICNASVPTVLSIDIKYDNTILATVKNSMIAGYHTVSAPYIIPTVATGIHEITMIVSCDAGQITIDQNCMNLSLTAQYLNSKMPELPHAEKKEDVPWVDIRSLFFGDTNTIASTIVDTPVPIGVVENISYISNIYNNQLSSSVSFSFVQVADQILFDAGDSSKFNTATTMVFDGTLHFKNDIRNTMTSADLGTNKVYTQSMVDISLHNTIENVLII
jgi:hypothetical protein